MKVKFIVYGEPFGKLNMRPVIRGGHASSFQPSKNASYMQQVKYAYVKCYGDFMFDEKIPLRVTIIAYKSVPKSVSNKKRKLMLSGAIVPTTKPDCDNISKVILDSLSKLAFHDDAQVAEELICKFYSEQPRVEVTIEDLNYEIHKPTFDELKTFFSD